MPEGALVLYQLSKEHLEHVEKHAMNGDIIDS